MSTRIDREARVYGFREFLSSFCVFAKAKHFQEMPKAQTKTGWKATACSTSFREEGGGRLDEHIIERTRKPEITYGICYEGILIYEILSSNVATDTTAT